MAIIVSACLLGYSCKYNGTNNKNDDIVQYCKDRDVIAVCPEVLGGLSIPRPPAEIVNGVVYNIDGVSVDAEFRRGASKALSLAKNHTIELAILQPRSPSCGCCQVYDGTFSGKLIKGKGIFAQLLESEGIPAIDADELSDYIACTNNKKATKTDQ